MDEPRRVKPKGKKSLPKGYRWRQMCGGILMTRNIREGDRRTVGFCEKCAFKNVPLAPEKISRRLAAILEHAISYTQWVFRQTHRVRSNTSWQSFIKKTNTIDWNRENAKYLITIIIIIRIDWNWRLQKNTYDPSSATVTIIYLYKWQMTDSLGSTFPLKKKTAILYAYSV